MIGLEKRTRKFSSTNFDGNVATLPSLSCKIGWLFTLFIALVPNAHTFSAQLCSSVFLPN